ncbi:hypothetical protein Tco_0674890, partial [Tanacetum coccineum]
QGRLGTEVKSSPCWYIKKVDLTDVRIVGGLSAAGTEEMDKGLPNSLKEDSVFVVTSKRLALDKCKQPVGIRLFVSATHTESDMQKAYELQKELNGYMGVNCSAQSCESQHSLAIQDDAWILG